MHVLMIYPKFPAETFWNVTRSVKRFTSCRADMPPLGLLTLASYLPADFQVRLIDRNCAEETDRDWEWADVIFLSLMMSQLEDYKRCMATAITWNKPVAVGGPFTHAMPEIAAEADWVCFGEAESVIDEIVKDVRAGVRGKQYNGGNTTDMTTVRLPRFELLRNVNDYVCMPLQFSRGCPFRCEFCDIIEIYGRVPRTKRPHQVLAELSVLKRLAFRGSVLVVDDNFIGNKKNAKLLLRELVQWNRQHRYPFRFMTEASLNLADDDELLDLMYRSNFVWTFIGIETPDPKLLKGTLKIQNIPGNPLARLRRIREHGIHVVAGLIIGFDGEGREVCDTQRTFIEASGIGTVTIGLLQAVPHTQLWRRLKEEGRLLESSQASMNTTTEGMNFIPNADMTKREYLAKYSELVHGLFQPEAYFMRILPALLALRYRPRHRGLFQVWWRDFPKLFGLIHYFGFQSHATRRHFWRTFVRLLWKNPLALEAFCHDCYFFYHLQQHFSFVRRELVHYLYAPSPEDVLDAIVPSRSVHTPTG